MQQQQQLSAHPFCTYTLTVGLAHRQVTTLFCLHLMLMQYITSDILILGLLHAVGKMYKH